MSLAETFTMPISLIETYFNSPEFEQQHKRLDLSNEFKLALIKRMDMLATILARR